MHPKRGKLRKVPRAEAIKQNPTRMGGEHSNIRCKADASIIFSCRVLVWLFAFCVSVAAKGIAMEADAGWYFYFADVWRKIRWGQI